MKIDYIALGRRIQKARKQLGKSQSDMAEALSLSVGYISQIERGNTKVSLERLATIADFLCCDLTSLLVGLSPGVQNYLSIELQQFTDRFDERQLRMLLEMAAIISRF